MTAAQQIDIEVLADPDSCQRTAAQLARLGQACVQVAGRLGRQAQVSEDDLGGLSGAVYRRSVARAAATCDRLAADCARLADGLADYARDIADVRRLMAQARATAAPWLTTCAWAIWSPGEPPDAADAALSQPVGGVARGSGLVAAGARPRGTHRTTLAARARPGCGSRRARPCRPGASRAAPP